MLIKDKLITHFLLSHRPWPPPTIYLSCPVFPASHPLPTSVRRCRWVKPYLVRVISNQSQPELTISYLQSNSTCARGSGCRGTGVAAVVVLSDLVVAKFDPEVGLAPSLEGATGANIEVPVPMLAMDMLGIGGTSLVESGRPSPGVCGALFHTPSDLLLWLSASPATLLWDLDPVLLTPVLLGATGSSFGGIPSVVYLDCENASKGVPTLVTPLLAWPEGDFV